MSTSPLANGLACPNCGHINRDDAAFCAECGTRLENGADDAQATAAFIPASSGTTDPEATWHAPNDDPYRTQEFAPQTTVSEPEVTATNDWFAAPVTHTYVPAQESSRGLVLGVIATILILLVIGFFAWSTLASEGFRDSVTGIF